MDVTLRVHLGETGVFASRVERPYAQAPRAGDLVWLTEDGAQRGFAWPVDQVVWNNDGSVCLVFRRAGEDHAVVSQLVGSGFERIDGEVPPEVRKALSEKTRTSPFRRLVRAATSHTRTG